MEGFHVVPFSIACLPENDIACATKRSPETLSLSPLTRRPESKDDDFHPGPDEGKGKSPIQYDPSSSSVVAKVMT